MRLDNTIRLGGGCYALQGLLPQGLVCKIALHQPTRDATDHHGIRRGQALETCGNVGCFPKGKVLLTEQPAYGADHYQPRMDAHSYRQGNMLGQLWTGP